MDRYRLTKVPKDMVLLTNSEAQLNETQKLRSYTSSLLRPPVFQNSLPLSSSPNAKKRETLKKAVEKTLNFNIRKDQEKLKKWLKIAEKQKLSQETMLKESNENVRTLLEKLETSQNECETLRINLNEREKEATIFTQQLTSIVKESEKAKEELKKYDERLISCEKLKGELITFNDELSNFIKDLAVDFESLQVTGVDKVNTLENKIKNLTIENDVFAIQCKKENYQLINNMEGLKKTISDNAVKTDLLNTDLQEANQQLQMSNKERENLQQLLNEVNNGYATLTEEFKKIKESASTEMVEKNSEIQELNDKLAFNIECLNASTVENDALKREVSSLNTIRDGFSTEIDKLTTERSHLKDEIEKLTIESNRLTFEYENIFAERDHLKTEKDSLMTEIEQLNIERNQLKIILDEMKVENSQLNAINDQFRSENDELNVENKEFKEENDLLMNKSSQLNEENNQLMAKIEQMQVENAQLKIKYEQSNTENDQLKIENKKLNVDYEQLKIEKEQLKMENEQLRVENDKLKIDHEQLKIEKDQLKIENEQLKIEIEKVNIFGEQLKIENEQLKIENEQLKIDHEQLKIENKQLKIDQEQLNIDHEKLKTDYEQLKIDHEKLNIDHEQLKIDHEKLKIDHEQLKINHEQLKIGHEQLKIETEQLSIENDKLKIKNEKLRIDDEQLKIENGQLKVENKQLKIENEKLNIDYEQLKIENGQMKVENERMKIENDQLNIGNEQMNVDDEQLKIGNGQMKIENEQLKIENEQIKMENVQLKIEKGRLNAEKIQLNCESNQFMMENEQLKIENKKINAENEQIKTTNDKLITKIYDLESENGELKFDRELYTETDGVNIENNEFKSGNGHFKTNNNYRAYIEQLKNEVDQLKKETSQLSNENGQLRAEINQFKVESKQLEVEYNQQMKSKEVKVSNSSEPVFGILMERQNPAIAEEIRERNLETDDANKLKEYKVKILKATKRIQKLKDVIEDNRMKSGKDCEHLRNQIENLNTDIQKEIEEKVDLIQQNDNLKKEIDQIKSIALSAEQIVCDKEKMIVNLTVTLAENDSKLKEEINKNAETVCKMNKLEKQNLLLEAEKVTLGQKLESAEKRVQNVFDQKESKINPPIKECSNVLITKPIIKAPSSAAKENVASSISNTVKKTVSFSSATFDSSYSTDTSTECLEIETVSDGKNPTRILLRPRNKSIGIVTKFPDSPSFKNKDKNNIERPLIKGSAEDDGMKGTKSAGSSPRDSSTRPKKNFKNVGKADKDNWSSKASRMLNYSESAFDFIEDGIENQENVLQPAKKFKI